MKICIVEGNPMFLESLRLMLNNEPDMEITDCYSNTEAALQKKEWHRVDILLTELDAPGVPGLEFIRRVNARNHNLRILVHTHREERDVVMQALQAGASGYVLKNSPYSKLISSLHEIFNGHVPVSPSISRMLLKEIQAMGASRRHRSPPLLPARPISRPVRNPVNITAREQAVLQYLNQRLTQKEIAAQLAISESTVHSHVKNIYHKLHAHNKEEALRKARYHHLV